jgi:peptide chain release factor 1
MMDTVEFDPKKLLDYLESLHKKYKTVESQLAQPEIVNNHGKYRELSRELSHLKPLSEKYELLTDLQSQKRDAENLLEEPDDEDMKELAREEIETLTGQIEDEQDEIFRLLASDHREDNRNVFLEIRAGAGGDEASLFARGRTEGLETGGDLHHLFRNRGHQGNHTAYQRRRRPSLPPL